MLANSFVQYQWLKTLSKDSKNTVVGLVRTPAKVHELLAKDKLNDVQIFPADMASHESLADAATQVASSLPGNALDVLIINGAHQAQDTKHLYAPEWAGKETLLHEQAHRSLDINVLGIVYTINEFLPLILRGAIKKIIVITSGAADPELARVLPMNVVYSAMKAALNMIVAKYASPLKSEGVIVLALSPGIVNTKETPRKYLDQR
jgi:NAD(P)-dependent dehydrogenase (short-subunit alcohol dehydrogenase family)